MDINIAVESFYKLYEESSLGANSVNKEEFVEAVNKKGDQWINNWHDSYENNKQEEVYWDIFYEFCEENNFEL